MARGRAKDRSQVPFAHKLVLNQWLLSLFGKQRFEDLAEHLRSEALEGLNGNNEHQFHHVLTDQLFNLTYLTLATVFNAPGGGQLHIENLKGATGEVALKLGADNEPFGVINVGGDAKLVSLCEERGLATGSLEFAGSLFHDINKPNSNVNLLIGSKKFTEGWSSWRVSTMGLMNVGKGEGAQIIQLFGRGVRLKGYNMSLKRSSKATLPERVERPKQIAVLETLGIFGIHADYMARFREYLEEEGLPTNDDRIEIQLPVITHLGAQQLKTIRLKRVINGQSTEGGHAFRTLGPVPTVRPPSRADANEVKQLQQNKVIVNWYPKIQAMKSAGLTGADSEALPNVAHLTAKHLAFLDLDRIYFELERFKAERGWYNLNLTCSGLETLLADQSWYELLIPAEELACDSFEKVRTWHEIALALLKKYTERYYKFRKSEWELPHLEYRVLESGDPNFLAPKQGPGEGHHTLLIDSSDEELVVKLEELKAKILAGVLKPWNFRGIKAVVFGQHLYEPLLYVDQKTAEITPLPLNKGEWRFVEDLKKFHDSSGNFFAGKELYLLRNLSKGRGVGFFEAGNVHPDFMLWVLSAGRQDVIFVDPKGIRQLPVTDLKIQFHEAIKVIEARLSDPAVHLHSFIVSNTPSATMEMQWNVDKAAMQKRNILFQEEDAATYIRTMLERV